MHQLSTIIIPTVELRVWLVRLTRELPREKTGLGSSAVGGVLVNG